GRRATGDLVVRVGETAEKRTSADAAPRSRPSGATATTSTASSAAGLACAAAQEPHIVAAHTVDAHLYERIRRAPRIYSPGDHASAGVVNPLHSRVVDKFPPRPHVSRACQPHAGAHVTHAVIVENSARN